MLDARGDVRKDSLTLTEAMRGDSIYCSDRDPLLARWEGWALFNLWLFPFLDQDLSFFVSMRSSSDTVVHRGVYTESHEFRFHYFRLLASVMLLKGESFCSSESICTLTINDPTRINYRESSADPMAHIPISPGSHTFKSSCCPHHRLEHASTRL